eukprot:jgi/Chlat1/8523/Chrsp80S07900
MAVTGSALPGSLALALGCRVPSASTVSGRSQQKRQAIRCSAQQQQDQQPDGGKTTKREIMLNSSSALLLASIFHFSGERPTNIGVRKDVKSLQLCPRTPNCISTAEEANDPGHYVPPWTYNPEDGRGTPDNFTPKIIKQTDDYLYAEFESNLFGFTDDVEFYFPGGPGSIVEYRSASRLGESDFDINRKRIKALRLALQEKGWRSIGF